MYVNSDSLIEQSIASLISHHFPPSELLNKCFQHLITIISNLLERPEEEKYKLIKKSNEKILREVLIFQEAIEFLYFIGFEEIDIDSMPCLIYNGGIENRSELELALKVLRNKQKNELSNNDVKANQTDKSYVKDFKDLAIEKEVQNRKREIEEMKEVKEQIIKDFESNKKYNLEIKKTSQNESSEKNNQINRKKNSIGNNVVLGSNNPIKKPKDEEIIIPQKNQFKKNIQKRNTLVTSKKNNKNKNSKSNNQEKKPGINRVVSLKDYGKIE